MQSLCRHRENLITMESLVDEFMSFGMELNMAAGKTTLQIMAYGKGGDQLKARIAALKANCLLVEGTLKGTVALLPTHI